LATKTGGQIMNKTEAEELKLQRIVEFIRSHRTTHKEAREIIQTYATKVSRGKDEEISLLKDIITSLEHKQEEDWGDRVEMRGNPMQYE